ncbi:hypothetical protein ACFSGI_13270 [Paenibacillus nicotianae]|uniref:Tumour necrosis factor receptor superfamily member 19 n=1 Tax=Paenibacillus nicotianae TaxID=1526551 RepID=A0ABW4UTN9_9BACL
MNGIGFIIVTVVSAVAGVLYYAGIGKRIAHEEKKAGRDLTYEINPFTGGRE